MLDLKLKNLNAAPASHPCIRFRDVFDTIRAPRYICIANIPPLGPYYAQ